MSLDGPVIFQNGMTTRLSNFINFLCSASQFVTVSGMPYSNYMLCGSAGYLYCLNKNDSTILWVNGTPIFQKRNNANRFIRFAEDGTRRNDFVNNSTQY